MKTAGRSAAVRGSYTKQNVRYMQQPSWLQSAPPYNVHSVHLLIVQLKILICKTAGRRIVFLTIKA